MIVVRYADDTIVCFEHQHDAKRFLEDLSARMTDFGLGLHPAKRRLIEFGRKAIATRRARGLRKPETFDFLGSRTIARPDEAAVALCWEGRQSACGCGRS
jgi:RNA-directed DNA polymerase